MSLIFGVILFSLGLWTQFHGGGGPLTASYRDDTVYVEAMYGKEARIPKEAELHARLITPDGVDGRIPIGEAIQKSVIDNEKEGYLTYTVTVDIPKSSYMQSMLGRDKGHELDLPYFYLEDDLEFTEGQTTSYYALNAPKDVTIYVTSKDTTNSWSFEEAPCVSGNGDDEARETFQILPGS